MKNTVTILFLFFISLSTFFVNSVYSSPQYVQHGQQEQTQAVIPLMGKVVETMNGGGYTYILLQSGAKQIWVAIRETIVVVGQNVALEPGIEMSEFTSKSIDRTFSTIIFSNGLISSQGNVLGSSQAPHGSAHGGTKKTPPSTSGSKGHIPAADDNIKVDKASEENAYTIVELFEKRSELNKKNIVLNGKVVKASAQIMGKNWLHIQDGTGDSQNGTNDIVVTTMDMPSVGDVVTVKGILYTDKDFGSGYKYDVIIEQARVTK
ncbi:MAG: DNA-binding protein [Candidatus Anammoxibacter sp.]